MFCKIAWENSFESLASLILVKNSFNSLAVYFLQGKNLCTTTGQQHVSPESVALKATKSSLVHVTW